MELPIASPHDLAYHILHHMNSITVLPKGSEATQLVRAFNTCLTNCLREKGATEGVEYVSTLTELVRESFQAMRCIQVKYAKLATVDNNLQACAIIERWRERLTSHVFEQRELLRQRKSIERKRQREWEKAHLALLGGNARLYQRAWKRRKSK